MSILAGKVALITGASGGIGGATAEALAAAGAQVVLHYFHNQAGAEAVRDRIAAAGGSPQLVAGDIASSEDCARIVAAAGTLDILINCAGTAPQLAFGAITRANFTALIDENVLGSILMMQEAVAHFPPSGGRIVNVGSNLSYGPMAGLVPYAAAKAAIITLTQGFARELSGRNIAINCIAPGATDTPMTAWIPEDIRASIAAATPLGRMAAPEDIADIIVFLASPAARWINGRTIIADGGLI
jgi:3-oxoacyl-[acyl-carrier protein] reductase